jgi:hypothetical protein
MVNIIDNELNQGFIYKDFVVLTANEIFKNVEVKKKYNTKFKYSTSIHDLNKLNVGDYVVHNVHGIGIYNGIKTLTRSPKTIELFDQYFVGFLTNTNGFIILRNMVHGKKELPEFVNERYCFYSIVEHASSGYYTIPTVCDIHKHIDIHIAEGTFDILSVFYNMRNANRAQNVYASIGGNAYVNIIKNYFLCNLGIIDADFHIYIDNNIESEILDNIRYYIGSLGLYKIFIHMNTYRGEKDFGVSKEKINEYVYQLV